MNLSDLTDLFSWTAPAMLIFARVTALFATGPVIGGGFCPPQAKALLSVAITGIIVATQGAQPIPVDLSFFLLLIKEVMVGVSLGFFTGMFVYGIRFGADLINRHAGYSAAEYFDPETEAIASPIGDLFNIAVMLLFLMADGHHFFIAALTRSYELVPLGTWTQTPALTSTMIAGVQQLSVIALAISFPVLAAVMAVTVAEGVIVRAIPQINMLHFSFAVKIMLSLMMLYAGVPAAVAFMGVVMSAMQEAGYALLRVM
jgi:flagellar biosynthetic protein FliR